jgi:hypothetical protein
MAAYYTPPQSISTQCCWRRSSHQGVARQGVTRRHGVLVATQGNSPFGKSCSTTSSEPDRKPSSRTGAKISGPRPIGPAWRVSRSLHKCRLGAAKLEKMQPDSGPTTKQLLVLTAGDISAPTAVAISELSHDDRGPVVSRMASFPPMRGGQRGSDLGCGLGCMSFEDFSVVAVRGATAMCDSDNHVVLDTSGMMRSSAGHGAVTAVRHIETPASQHISKLSSGNRRFPTTWPSPGPPLTGFTCIPKTWGASGKERDGVDQPKANQIATYHRWGPSDDLIPTRLVVRASGARLGRD